MAQEKTNNSWLPGAGIVLLVLSVGLIAFGNIVHTTGSGMGCEDFWPSCNGVWFPDLSNYRVAIEYLHRVYAGGIGILSMLFFGLIWFWYPNRKRMKKLAFLSFLFLVATATFGAITVKLELSEPLVTVIHLGGSMAFLGLLSGTVSLVHQRLSIASVPEEQREQIIPTYSIVQVTMVVTYVQILLGGLSRHTGEQMGLFQYIFVLPAYKLTFLPVESIPNFLLQIPLVHLGVGIAVVILVMKAARSLRETAPDDCNSLAFWGIFMVHLQVLLGFAAPVIATQIYVTTMHVIIAALLFAGLVWVQVQFSHLIRSNNLSA